LGGDVVENKGSEGQLGFRRAVQTAWVAAFLGLPVAVIASPSAEELDQRIKILERQLEIQKEEAETKAKDATSTTLNDKGVTFKKGDFQFKLRGLVQGDVRAFVDDRDDRAPSNAGSNAILSANKGSSDGFLFRRIRPTIEADFGKYVGLRLTPEFAGAGDAEAASLVDAYIDLKFSPAATVRAGKVKGPVSLERLQSGGSLTFVERGFPSELAPNRDLGVQLQGELFGAKLAYVIGAYDGTADGRNANVNADNRLEYAARLFAEPFKDDANALSGLGFGVAGTVGSKDQTITRTTGGNLSAQGRADHSDNYAGQANPVLPRYRTPGQNTFFSYVGAEVNAAGTALTRTGVYADGDHVRISPQAYWYWNSIGLLGEYITSEQEVGLNNVTEEFENKAWQISASYVLTGEDASFRGVTKIDQPFAIGGPGWGALELAARYGELKIDEDVFDPVSGGSIDGVAVADTAFANPATAAQEAKNWTVGLNWYLTTNAKLVLNYGETSFEGGAAATDGGTSATAATARDRKDEKAAFARLQLSF
jgi:phosphate-selective porin OprO and OprP